MHKIIESYLEGGEIMKTAQKFMRSLSLLGAVSLMFISVLPAMAAQLTGTTVSMSDTSPSTASNHTFAFTLASATNLRKINALYCLEASGSCTAPTGMGLGSATFSNTMTVAGADNYTWTMATTGGNSITIGGPTDITVSAADVLGFVISSITNPTIAGCNASSNSSTGTCYVRVTTYDSIATVVDTTIASITVIENVTVTATVDPTFTMVIDAVASGVVNNGITTSVTSTYSTMPFGHLTAATPKYGAQSLAVTTNTQSGYTVSVRMATQMTGQYSSNNIDPYAATGAAWGTPIAWTEPTGTGANVDTGWVGANTTDTDVSGWSSATAKFGPIDGTAVTVMSSSSSDNGANPVYVTYAVEANVYQPADTYTGNLIYTALPNY